MIILELANLTQCQFSLNKRKCMYKEQYNGQLIYCDREKSTYEVNRNRRYLLS